MKVVGIDACQGKWLAVGLDEGRFETARLAATAAALAEEWRDAAAIGVDIPIGLPNEPWRDADRAARKFVEERRSSVFPTFPATVLEAATYEEAKTICVANNWPQPSIQSYGMRIGSSKLRRLRHWRHLALTSGGDYLDPRKAERPFAELVEAWGRCAPIRQAETNAPVDSPNPNPHRHLASPAGRRPRPRRHVLSRLAWFRLPRVRRTGQLRRCNARRGHHPARARAG